MEKAKESNLDPFELQYQDFCDTESLTSNYDDLRFSLSTPIQESNGNNICSTCSTSHEELVIGVKIHWLAGLFKMNEFVSSVQDPHCTEKFEKYTEGLKEYLQKRVIKIRNNKCGQYTVRTDCAWGLEKTDIQDACAVIVHLLALDAEGMKVSGELTRSTLKIHLLNI